MLDVSGATVETETNATRNNPDERGALKHVERCGQLTLRARLSSTLSGLLTLRQSS